MDDDEVSEEEREMPGSGLAKDGISGGGGGGGGCACLLAPPPPSTTVAEERLRPEIVIMIGKPYLKL